MHIMHLLGFSSKTYRYPVFPGGKKPVSFAELGWKSPAHVGEFWHAVDLQIPDPRVETLNIYAPQDGVIVALKQGGNGWGHTASFNNHRNYMTVQVPGSLEFWQICHLARGSCPFKAGDRIHKGDVVGRTGLNGWTTATNGVPDAHVHLLVGHWKNRGKTAFYSVRIRF